MKFKKILASLLLFSLLSSQAYADSVAGIKFLNNTEVKLDYKVSKESSEQTAKGIRTQSEEKEIFYGDTDRAIGNLTVPEKNSASETGDDPFTADKFKALTTPLEERELSWLIENNIVSREKQISVDQGNVEVKKAESLYDKNNPLEPMTKTDFLMGTYKSIYGVIESRPVLIKIPAWRNAEKENVEEVLDEDGNVLERIITYDPKANQQVTGVPNNFRYIPEGTSSPVVRNFNEGDYLSVVSPNVFELYLKGLLDKKIVDPESISDMEFRSDYAKFGASSKSFTQYPRWANTVGPYLATDGAEQNTDLTTFTEKTRVWGKSFTFISNNSLPANGCSLGGDFSCKDKGSATDHVMITDVKDTVGVKYFVDETLDSISALKYVEAMLRLTEKDMTDTEARIISYKYGANYLDLLDDEDRKTVMFLTAKGILNFEDLNEYKNLYGAITKEFSYKLMYRLANKNARLDFSKIQITDSDNFWIDKGFSQVKVGLNMIDSAEASKYRNEDGSYMFSPVPDVETLSAVVINTEIVQPQKTVSFLGIKFFSAKSSYAANESKSKTYSVKKVFDDGRKYTFAGIKISDTAALTKSEWVNGVSPTGAKSTQVTVDFKVQATSTAMAISTIDSRLSVGSDFLFKQSGISAVTKYEDSGKPVTLIPASVFKSSGPQLGQKILVMEDKVLKNLETGTTAVLLTDKDMALIGTHVITGKDMMVKSINGEKYYNLEVIRYLLSNTYISDLDPDSVYVSSGVLNEKLANVIPVTGQSIGKTYVMQTEVEKASGDPSASATKVTTGFVNISQLTTASNFLIKQVEIRDTVKKKTVEFKILMQLTYSLPNKDANFLNPIYKKANPGFGDLNSFIYEKPNDPELLDWWDNNIELSNAFANEIYGTSGVKYVKSGYLVPNITVLYDSSDVIQEKYLAKFFENVGTHLSDDWVSKFMGDVSTYNKLAPSGTDSTNKDSKYYPEKTIGKNQFPLWIHAMFNNTAAGVDPGIYSGNKPAGKENTSLWRYLMSNRTLSYGMSSTTSKALKMYTGGSGDVYIETNGGAIYREVNDSDVNFAGKIIAGSKNLTGSEDWSKLKNFTFKPTTRTESSNMADWEGKQITDSTGKYKFLVKGIDGENMRLVDNIPVIGSPDFTKKGSKAFVEIIGTVNGKGTVSKTSIKGRYDELRKLILNGMSGYDDSIPTFDKAKNLAWYPSSNESIDKYVLIDKNQNSLNKASDKIIFKSSSIGTWYSHDSLYKETKLPKVHAYTSIVLNTNYWTVSDKGVLMPRKTIPFLQVGNIYFSGINQGVIDAILAKSVGTISVNKIEEGATLMIGDMILTKKGNSFVSQPQENIKAWSGALRNANDATAVKSNIFSVFAGMGINKNQAGKTSIDTSNVTLPIVSFMTNAKLAVPSNPGKATTILGGGGNSKAYVYTYKSKDSEATIKAYNAKNPPSVTGVTFSVDLNSVLLARKIDTGTKAYQLMMTTNSLSDGFLDDIPFFSEKLSMATDEDVMLLANKSTFKGVSYASELKNQFNLMYNRTLAGDLYTTMIAIFVMAMMWMVLAIFMIYMMKKSGSMDTFLQLLSEPKSGRKGVDIIKVISFGIFNIDSKLGIGKMVLGSSLILFCVSQLMRLIQ